MSDDIVTRLRNGHFIENDGCGEPYCVSYDCSLDKKDFRQAADEIERLRKWKEIADMFGECFRMDEYGQFPTSNDGDVLEAVKAWERLKKEETK